MYVLFKAFFTAGVQVTFKFLYFYKMTQLVKRNALETFNVQYLVSPRLQDGLQCMYFGQTLEWYWDRCILNIVNSCQFI